MNIGRCSDMARDLERWSRICKGRERHALNNRRNKRFLTDKEYQDWKRQHGGTA